jgi:hypothetical protein
MGASADKADTAHPNRLVFSTDAGDKALVTADPELVN